MFSILQHSPSYSENQFIDIIEKDTGLSILNVNIYNAFTKFDELEIIIQMINVSNPVIIICLNELWLSDQSNVSTLPSTNYIIYTIRLANVQDILNVVSYFMCMIQLNLKSTY